jgi:hypothetical protein
VALLTESGDRLVTESGDALTTESDDPEEPMDTLAFYLANPAVIAALLASRPAPIEDSMAISIAKNPALVAMIAKQLADNGWNSGSP